MGIRKATWLDDIQLMLECTNYEDVKLRLISIENVQDSDVIKLNVEIGVPNE